MAMRRSSGSGTDSLELLLDTICNMFGGIVFISLLVALLIQSSEGKFEKPVEILDSHDIELLQADLEISKQQLSRVQEARKNQLELIESHVSNDLQSDLDQLKSLSGSHTELEDQAQGIREENLERFEQINNQNKADAELQAELKKTEQQVAELEQAKSRLHQTKGVRLPQAKRVFGLNRIQVSLHFNRFYIRHDLSKLQQGLRVPNLADYLVTSTNSSSIEIQPKPTAGVPMREKEQARRLIKSRLRAFSNRSWQIDITLRPDSHESFRMLREILAEAGYHYSVLATGGEVQDRGGNDRLAQ